MTEGTENATVESRLTAVETKTDRLIKDVEGCRGEIKELRDIVEANDKALRNDMQAMESRLIARQDETASAFRDDLRATENSLRQEIQGTAKELRDEIQGTAKELRDEIQGTAKELRDEIQGTAKELRDEIQGTAKGLRDEIKAHESKIDVKLEKINELVADTKGQLKILTLLMVPLVVGMVGIATYLLRNL